MNTQRAGREGETAEPPEHSRSLRKLRDGLGLSQADFARLLGFSTRWVATQEGAEAGMPAERRVLEVERLYEALCQIVKPEALKGWLNRPNTAFDGLKPLEVVERGQIDRLWRMIFFLESGVTS